MYFRKQDDSQRHSLFAATHASLPGQEEAERHYASDRVLTKTEMAEEERRMELAVKKKSLFGHFCKI